MRRFLISLTIAILLGAGIPVIAGAHATKKPQIFPPQSHPYGLSYGKWQARWTQWAFGIPAADNPGLDETGAKCGVGQRGPVWFTSFVTHPGATTRSCTIPAGKALFVLATANECSNIEPPPFFGSTEAELRACAAEGYAFAFPVLPSISVDGSAVPNLGSFRTQTPLFRYTLPADNLFGFPAGTTATKAISDGIFVMIKPMRRGLHTVAIHIESPALGTIDEVYNLTVTGDEDDD